jgi:hypothetical protein
MRDAEGIKLRHPKCKLYRAHYIRRIYQTLDTAVSIFLNNRYVTRYMHIAPCGYHFSVVMSKKSSLCIITYINTVP